MKEADEIIVTDTGSTDGTVEKLRELGAVVHIHNIDPWRFDIARNIALSHVAEDADICVSCDLDEVFEKGWRAKLEKAWAEDVTIAKYKYNWSFGIDGSPDVQYNLSKIHSRHDYKWVYPVHECLEYIGDKQEKAVFVDGMVVNHFPDSSKSRGQYLPLLELAVKENPDNDRLTFWLGREYIFYQKYDECIATLKRYLNLESATWNEERSAGYRFIARAYQGKGDMQNAKLFLLKAIAECAYIREPYLHLARLGYVLSDWPLAYFAASEALKITEKTNSYLFESQGWGYEIYDLGAISAFHLGAYNRSHELAKIALELEPDNARLKQNLDIIKTKLTG